MGAQLHQQIADHRGLAFIVKLYRLVLLETLERHFSHAHRPVHDKQRTGNSDLSRRPEDAAS